MIVAMLFTIAINIAFLTMTLRRVAEALEKGNKP